VPVIAGKQTTVPVLEKNSFGKGAQVSGRVLKRGADDALKTIKKAVSFVLSLLNDDGSPHNSGNRVDDVDAKVLDFMLCLLKGKNTVDDVKEDKAEDDVVAEAKHEVEARGEAPALNPNRAPAFHPGDWFFHGWIAFELHVLMAPPPEKMHFDPHQRRPAGLSEGVSKTSDGQAAHKERDALEKENI
jgi:hypothetical protein